jgi:hypothetical protein
LRSEFKTASSQGPSLKFNEVIFKQCPVSAITPKTWEILRIVNTTTDGECNIILPYRGSSYKDQPKWYLQAVEIVRNARAKNQRIKHG